MSITSEEFQKAYRTASIEKKALIDSGKIYESIEMVLSKAPFKGDPRELMLNFSYHLLGLQSAGVVIQTMESAGVSNAHLLFQEILEKIEVVPAVSTITEEEVAEAELQTEIVETELALDSVQNIRTMAADMRAIQRPTEIVHTSSQSDLLQRKDAAPRWDSGA